MSRRRGKPALAAALITALAVCGIATGANPASAATIQTVAVSQAGYSAGGYKVASVVADGPLPAGTDCRILQGETSVTSCALGDRGETWGSRVYEVDFSTLTAVGDDYAIEVGGVRSPRFSV